MSNMIESGTGTGYRAEVDSTNRLKTKSVADPGWAQALADGEHYAVTPGSITLTSANQSAVLYLKNNSDRLLLIDRIIVNTADSTSGATDEFLLSLYRNPTAMSSGSGNDLTQINTNFSSSKSLQLVSEAGAEGASFSETAVASFRVENPTRHRVFESRILLGRGASIGLAVTPPASNTSMATAIILNSYLLTGF